MADGKGTSTAAHVEKLSDNDNENSLDLKLNPITTTDTSDHGDIDVEGPGEAGMTKAKLLAIIALALSYTTSMQQSNCTASIMRQIDIRLGEHTALLNVVAFLTCTFRADDLLQLDAVDLYHRAGDYIATVWWSLRYLWPSKVLLSWVLCLAAWLHYSRGRTEYGYDDRRRRHQGHRVRMSATGVCIDFASSELGKLCHLLLDAETVVMQVGSSFRVSASKTPWIRTSSVRFAVTSLDHIRCSHG